MKPLFFALVLASAALAQGPSAPPPIVQISCQSGYSAAPEKPYASAKAAVDAIGMLSTTGAPQTWTIELHENFASIEDLDKAIAAAASPLFPRDAYAEPHDELLAPPRTVIAI